MWCPTCRGLRVRRMTSIFCPNFKTCTKFPYNQINQTIWNWRVCFCFSKNFFFELLGFCVGGTADRFDNRRRHPWSSPVRRLVQRAISGTLKNVFQNLRTFFCFAFLWFFLIVRFSVEARADARRAFLTSLEAKIRDQQSACSTVNKLKKTIYSFGLFLFFSNCILDLHEDPDEYRRLQRYEEYKDSMKGSIVQLEDQAVKWHQALNTYVIKNKFIIIFFKICCDFDSIWLRYTEVIESQNSQKTPPPGTHDQDLRFQTKIFFRNSKNIFLLFEL